MRCFSLDIIDEAPKEATSPHQPGGFPVPSVIINDILLQLLQLLLLVVHISGGLNVVLGVPIPKIKRFFLYWPDNYGPPPRVVFF